MYRPRWNVYTNGTDQAVSQHDGLRFGPAVGQVDNSAHHVLHFYGASDNRSCFLIGSSFNRLDISSSIKDRVLIGTLVGITRREHGAVQPPSFSVVRNFDWSVFSNFEDFQAKIGFNFLPKVLKFPCTLRPTMLYCHRHHRLFR